MKHDISATGFIQQERARQEPLEVDQLVHKLAQMFLDGRRDVSSEAIAAFLAREFIRARNQVRRELAETITLEEDLRPPGALVLASFQRQGPDGVARAVEHHMRGRLHQLLHEEQEPLEFFAEPRG